MEPYVIRQGDHLLGLAYQFGFDADAVWNDPKNAQLRQRRPNQNILYPSDVLYIPDQNVPPAMKSLTLGSTNTFVANAPAVTFTIQFVGQPFASQSYTLQELPELTGLTTGADGTASFTVPVTQPSVTLVFTDSGTTYRIMIGHLDPITTLSGVFQRLRSLGFIDADANFDPTDLDFMRAALRAFKAAQTGGASLPTGSAPASSPPPSSDSNPPPACDTVFASFE